MAYSAYYLVGVYPEDNLGQPVKQYLRLLATAPGVRANRMARAKISKYPLVTAAGISALACRQTYVVDNGPDGWEPRLETQGRCWFMVKYLEK